MGEIVKIALLYSGIIGGIVALLFLCGAIEQAFIDEKERAEAGRLDRLRRENDARRAKEEQEQIGAMIAQAREAGTHAINKIPKELLDTERHLEAALADFEERAFSPFWEAISSALTSISNVTYCLYEVSRQLKKYKDWAAKYEGDPQHFPISLIDTIQIDIRINSAKTRLSEIVRRAQKDFQFATIYEQNRTNKILIAGFNSLTEAVNGIGDRIAGSIGGLTEGVGKMELALERHHIDAQASREEVNRLSDQHHREIVQQRAAIANEQTREAQKLLGMVDNLQRNRKPLANEKGARTF